MKKFKRSMQAFSDSAVFSARVVPFERFVHGCFADGEGATLMGGGQDNNPGTSPPAGGATGADASGAKPDDNKQTPTEGGEGKPEPKPDDGKPADGKPAPKAPEKYEFKMPEGVTLDPDVLGEFEGIARELDLPMENAQKLADLGVKLTQKFAEQTTAALAKASGEWLAQVKADPEIGSDENLAIAAKARNAFATTELRKLLDESRLGNHPEVVRLFVKLGKAISEDKLVTGGQGPAAEKSAAQTLYPNQK